jgi:hypothetical protein
MTTDPRQGAVIIIVWLQQNLNMRSLELHRHLSDYASVATSWYKSVNKSFQAV